MDKTDIPGTFNAGATLGPVNETNMTGIWNKHKQTNTPLKRKVFVGVSGGVDSSVALALLKKEGCDVTGVFLKVWQPPPFSFGMECDWKEERRSAMRVCATLGVPFLTLNCEKEYKKEVVDYMLREYAEGRVPNPDVFCNKFVKFGVFLKKALEMGADYIATGHYARVVASSKQLASRKNLTTSYSLLESTDKEKDQSYFLYTLGQKELSHTIFPVGGMTKPEVRKLAKKFGLPTAEKKDSQGICFIGKVDMKEFLSRYISPKRGDVLNTAGKVIGTHSGAHLYAIGERHGFEVIEKSPEIHRLFVVSKDMEKNTLTVASSKQQAARDSETSLLATSYFAAKEVVIKDLHFIAGTSAKATSALGCRIRYRQEKHGCRVEKEGNGYRIVFRIPQEGVSVGQSAVLYDGDMCLGGGIMEEVR